MKPTRRISDSKPVIYYTTQKNALTALFGQKDRTFYLSSPSSATVNYLFWHTRFQEVAEGKLSMNKDESSKIVAAATVKLKFLRRPFAWYLRQKLDQGTLLQLCQVVATLIKPDDYIRPLTFEAACLLEIKWHQDYGQKN